MEQVVARENMLKAVHRVEQNRGAAGTDGMTVEALRPYLQGHWTEIKSRLLMGRYHPQPVRRVEIPKTDGGVRLLGIPTVLDRLIQQAMLQVLTPIFDPRFNEASYGFRPGRNAHQAIERARTYLSQGYLYVVDIDLEKFFDTVNHDILMNLMARTIRDKRVLSLIGRYLRAGVMVEGCCVLTEQGTPQGGPLSPLLANILLDELDRELSQRGHQFTRYADDCNIYVKSLRAGERVMASVSRYVNQRLRLKVNQQKSGVDKASRRTFLGVSFLGGTIVRIRLASKTIEKFKERIRQLTSRSKSLSMEVRITKLNQYLRGWIAYFKVADTPSVLQRFDEWTRRRLRMCLLKQWKNPRTQWRNLVQLGITAEWARLISGSRKAHWRLSNSPQVNKALDLCYWNSQGLVSLVERYHYYRATS
jgi:RNA-directed DNA polymerase